MTAEITSELEVPDSAAAETEAAPDAPIPVDAAPIPLPRSELEAGQLQRIVEGALLAAGKPLTIEDIAALFDEYERPNNDAIRAALAAIAEQCAGRGFELREVASGYRFQVIQHVAPWIARLWEEKPQRYSRALLETLALIAYRQPITRGDIEDIRGVAVASNIIKTLLERDWVRVVGHKDVPGRPALYATTRKFLDYFNLKNLDDLPTLAEIRDLDSLNAELALEGIDTVMVSDQSESTELSVPPTQPLGDIVAVDTTEAIDTAIFTDDIMIDTARENSRAVVADSESDAAELDVNALAGIDTTEAIDTSIFSASDDEAAQ